jgi:hypothetical protein
MGLDDLLGNQIEIGLDRGVFVEIHVSQIELRGQGLGDVLLFAEFELHQRFTNTLAVLGRVDEGILQRFLADHVPTDENLADFFMFSGHGLWVFTWGNRSSATSALRLRRRPPQLCIP